MIVCAGSFGKEALAIAEMMNERQKQWNILGFLDDNIPAGTEIYHGYRIIGNLKDWEPKENEEFAMGVANPATKEKIYNLMKEKGAYFATLINPTVYIKPEFEFGEGCIIGAATLGINVKLGKCVKISGSMVGSSTIGDFSTTTGYANIAGATLGKRVFVGSHAAILNGRTVGDDAFICAGSIVMTNVKPGTKVMGYPAKKFNI